MTDPAHAGMLMGLHFELCQEITRMTEPKPVAEAIITLLDSELVKHQGYATEARGRGLSGLAAYYDTMSLGIVECIRSIRTNTQGDASWQAAQRVASEQPSISNGQTDVPPS